MTALNLDYPMDFKLIITPIKGVSMGDIVEIVIKKAAYIEVAARYLLEDEPLEFYFCNKDGANITVNEGNNRITGSLPSRSSEPGEYEYAFYRIMGALHLVGEVEEIKSGFEDMIQVWVSNFPVHSDVCGGTP